MAQDKKYEISVAAESKYLADQSDEPAGRYVFAYTITLRNTGTVPAQLISRHWIITDANNHVQEVKGLGVVGEQRDVLVGTMRGTYQMVADDGTKFDAPIPEFTLAIPRTLH